MNKVIESYKLEGYVKKNYGYMDLYEKPEEQKKELQAFIRECEDHLNANSIRAYSSVQLEIVPQYKEDYEREELLKNLFEQVVKFMKDNRVTCVETIHQTDRVIENAYEFMSDLFEIVEPVLDIKLDDF